MKHRGLLIVLCSALLLLQGGDAAAQTGRQRVSSEQICSGFFAPRTAGGGIRSMSDGEYYTETDRAQTRIMRYSFATGKQDGILFDVKKARECPFDEFDDYEISPTGTHILLFTNVKPIYRRSFTATVYDYDVRRNLVKPLSEAGGGIRIPTFSPDGNMVAFVRENDIFIKKFDFDTEVRVSTDGKRNAIINGATDWVYEEEFATTNLMTWSKDGAFLAYVRSDESKVPSYTIPFYLGRLYPEGYTYKYPKPGEPNSAVSLHLYNVADRSAKTVDLQLTPDDYIPRVSFTERTDDLAVFTLNRRQDDFRLFSVNARSLVKKLMMEDKNKCYVESYTPESLRFLNDGFVFLSERDGWRHIYRYGYNGELKKQITTGKFDVTEIYGVDPSGSVYYQSAEESPLRRAIYRTDAKGRKTKLSTGQGTNDAVFSQNFAYFINTFSNSDTPPLIALYDSRKAEKPLRVLEDNAALKKKLSDTRFTPKEFITVKTDGNQELNAWITKPVDFNPSKKYPVLMMQYSGPDSQEVLDKFAFGWENDLCEKGFVVVCVDGRGTGARGEEWRKCTYMNLGILESDDQIAAARALAQLPYVDGSRMAIWGWSFGGYNAIMSMLRGGNTFKACIAVAPVTDWRFYDTVYTERFMRTPQENPEGYRKGSALSYVDGLSGKLLLIHGSADDNVQLQNTMDFAEALVRAGKQFDMAVYTDKNHGIYGGNTRLHLYTRMTDYLLKNL